MKERRHAKILELIQKWPIDTQEELLRRLCAEGFRITQATVSRDIKELRLVKTLSSDGKYRYTVGKGDVKDYSSKFYSLYSDSVIAIDTAQNIVVLKCLTGMANAVCEVMDKLQWDDVVGTLAGDNTIFVLTKDSSAANRIAAELKRMNG